MESFKGIILLIVSGNGILLSLALMSTLIKKNYSNFSLGIITWVTSIEMLNAWGVVVKYHGSNHYFPYWALGAYLMFPAAFWIFVRVNTEPAFQFKRVYWLLFLPAFVQMSLVFGNFYVNRLFQTHFLMSDYPIWFVFTEYLPVIAMIGVLGLYAWRLREIRLRQKWKGSIHLLKLYSFFILFFLFTTLWFVQGVVGYYVYFYIEILLSLFLLTLGFIAYVYPPFFEVPKLETPPQAKEEFQQYDDQKELKRLIVLFEEDKIYQKPRLSLSELAQKLKLPTRYLSYLINSYHHTNFRNFVNHYRVQEVLAKMQNGKDKHKTLLGIALESGFNSKSSFNQIFKNITGKTPSDYQKGLANKS